MPTLLKLHGCWMAVATLLIALDVGAAEHCEHAADRSAELPLSGIARVVIEAEAGSLNITGSEGQSTLSVQGKACASSDAMLEDIRLQVRTSGSTAYVTAETPSRLWNILDGTGVPSLDLDIRMPHGTVIEVTDSSGEMEIRGAGRTDIEDGSGSIVVADTTGDLILTDGSGSITLEKIGGDVLIEEDGSGSIAIEHVDGDVTVGRDGSGSIAIANAREVVIRRDGSGSIVIDKVDRDVTIHRDGSGSIDVSDLGGSLVVEHGGSGSVTHQRVKGSIRIDD